jgi:predicted anti-sigma-YlaC factor YlaD
MGYYSSLGYYLIGLSPVLALVLYSGITLPSVGTLVFAGVPFQWFLIEVTISTISVEVIGFVLYLFGHRKNESLPFSLGLNMFLVLWGILVTFYAAAMYGVLLDWTSLAHVTVTIWNHPEVVTYTTLAIMGLLWINSGIALTYMYWRSSKVASQACPVMSDKRERMMLNRNRGYLVLARASSFCVVVVKEGIKLYPNQRVYCVRKGYSRIQVYNLLFVYLGR